MDGINIAIWDPRGSLGTTYSLRPNVYGTVINRNWSVKEEVTTGYAKLDLDGELFGRNVSGNIGAQIVNTDQRSTGFVNDSGRCTGRHRQPAASARPAARATPMCCPA